MILIELEPVIRMSHENISVVNFDCRFAPNFEFCFDFLKMHDRMQQAKLHSFGGYYRLFLCNKIVISDKTQSDFQFFSKKVKSRTTNRQKIDKIYNILLFLLQKTSPKSIVLRTYGSKVKIILIMNIWASSFIRQLIVVTIQCSALIGTFIVFVFQ